MTTATARFDWPVPAWNASWVNWQNTFSDLVDNMEATSFAMMSNSKLIMKYLPTAEVKDLGGGSWVLAQYDDALFVSRNLLTEVRVTASNTALTPDSIIGLSITPGAVGQQNISWEVYNQSVDNAPEFVPIGYIDDTYDIRWYNGAELTAGGGVSTLFSMSGGGSGSTDLNEAYDAFGANPATINVDGIQGQGDVTWNLSGAYSHNIKLDNTTGTADGFQVYDGVSTEYFRLIRKLDNQIDLESELRNIDFNASGTLTLDSAGVSNLTATGANLTLSTATSGDLILSAADDMTFNDQYLSSAITLSESGETALDTTSQSIVGSINEVYGSVPSTLWSRVGTVLSPYNGGDTVEIKKAGTVKTITDMFTVTNSRNEVDMDGTGSGILFNQYYYDVAVPAVADAGRIAVVAETDWTSTASTQDAYMSFQTALDGVVAEKMRITSGGIVGIGTTDLDGTPPVGLLTVKGTSNDGSSYIFIGRDSDEANVILIDTDGQITSPSITSIANLALSATSNMTFDDQYLSSAITLSESGETVLDTTSQSIVGAINEIYGGGSGTTDLNDAYDNFGASAATITIDNSEGQGDLTFSPLGAFSFVTDISNCTGTSDGFEIVDGTGYLKVLHKGLNLADLNASLQVVDIAASTTISIVAGSSNDLTLGARSSTITINQSGSTSLSGFTATSIIGALNELKGGSITGFTIDDAYNNDSGERTITVDDGDISWDLSGDYSYVIDLSGCTNTSDGFFIEDGTDYFRLTHSGANTLDLDIALNSFDLSSAGAIVLTAAGDMTFDDQYLSSAIALSESGEAVLDTTSQSIVGAINELHGEIVGESLWDRTGTVLSPQTADDTIEISKAGTVKTTTDLIEIINSGNAADMDGTEAGLLYSLYYYDAVTPAKWNAGRIVVGAEQDATSTASTQDSYMAFATAVDGAVTERMRITSAGYVGIGITPTYKFSIGSTDGSDQIGLYHDNNNASVKWTDGSLYLMSDEGTNANTYVGLMGKGTGYSILQLFDENDVIYLEAVATGGKGYFRTAGVGASHLSLQDQGNANILMFEGSVLGTTKELEIYGYRSGDSLRALEIGCGVDAADTASFDGLTYYDFDGIVQASGGNAYSSAPASAISMGYNSSSGHGWMQVEGPATASPLNLQPDGSGVGIRGSWAAGGLHIYQSGWTWRTILEASSGQASIQFTGTGRASGDSYIIGRKNIDDTFAFAASYDLDTNRVFTINRSGLVAFGSTDFSGTPATGRLIAKGSSNDGSTNVQVWRDSDENNVAVLDTDGRFALVASPLTNMAAGDLLVGGGSLVLPEITTPTADTNYAKVYTKSDGKLYFQDGAGVEHELAFAGSAATFDQVYSAESGTHTITVDDGDMSWALTGAYSNIFDLSGCTGSLDGFFIEDGTDYFRLTHAALNAADLDFSVRYMDATVAQDIDWNVGTRSAKFEDQPYVAPNGGPGTPGGFMISTASDNLYIDSAAALFFDAAADSYFNVTGGDLILETTTSGDVKIIAADNVGIGNITPSYAFSIGSTNNTDQIGFYHDNTNAYCKWTDGYLYLSTDEGTNTNTIVNIEGKGTGYARLRVYDEDNEYLDLHAQNGVGSIYTAGASPQGLTFQPSGNVDIECFGGSTSGLTAEFLITGYRSGDSLRTLAIGCGVDYNDTASFDGLSNYFFDGIIQSVQGSDLTSANDMSTPSGNYCDVTGTTQVNTMGVSNIQAGTFICLQFDGSVTVKHATAGTGAQFQLSGSSDFSATAGDTLLVVYDGTYWRECSRTAI